MSFLAALFRWDTHLSDALSHLDAAIADHGALITRIQTDNAALREELAPTQGA